MALLVSFFYMFFLTSFASEILFYFFFKKNDHKNKFVAFLVPIFFVGIYILIRLVLRFDPLSVVWECHTDQCIADEIFMFVGYAAGGVLGVLVNGFIELRWQRQQLIRWGALNAICCFALLGTVWLFGLLSQPSKLEWKNQELAKSRRENGNFECVSINKYFSSEKDRNIMKSCLDTIEKFRLSADDAYLAWVNLRQFSSDEGFNYWYADDGSLVSVIPEKMQKDFLKIYFSIWMERKGFGQNQDLIDLKAQLKSLVSTHWSAEALRYFSREIAPKILDKLTPDAVPEVKALMNDIAKASQK